MTECKKMMLLLTDMEYERFETFYFQIAPLELLSLVLVSEAIC